MDEEEQDEHYHGGQMESFADMHVRYPASSAAAAASSSRSHEQAEPDRKRMEQEMDELDYWRNNYETLQHADDNDDFIPERPKSDTSFIRPESRKHWENAVKIAADGPWPWWTRPDPPDPTPEPPRTIRISVFEAAKKGAAAAAHAQGLLRTTFEESLPLARILKTRISAKNAKNQSSPSEWNGERMFKIRFASTSKVPDASQHELWYYERALPQLQQDFQEFMVEYRARQLRAQEYKERYEAVNASTPKIPTFEGWLAQMEAAETVKKAEKYKDAIDVENASTTTDATDALIHKFAATRLC